MSRNVELPQTEEEARLRAMQNVNDEPCGKLTNPTEIGLRRDRKN